MTRFKLSAFVALSLLLGLAGTAAADTFTGYFSVMWGDPRFPQVGGGMHYTLETPDGRYVSVKTTADPNALLALNGHAVIVTGQLAARPFVAGTANAAEIVADAIVADPSAPNAHDDGPKSVTGVRKVLFLMLKFSDDAAASRPDPHPASFYLAMTNPDTPSGNIPATINGFFKKTSDNKFSWTADVGGADGVPGTTWITLPHAKSYYANCGWSGSCFDEASFNMDAVAAGTAAGITWTNYDNINFVISNDLDCCAWGGSISIAAKNYGATWEPPWSQETRVYSHEMGHSIGLPHSGWVYFAYDSPWDVMSAYYDAVTMTCGLYVSTNYGGATESITCREPGNGYIMAHRDFLGWIPAANKATFTSGTLTTTLEAGGLAVGSATKMIKICISGWSCTGTSNTRYFTVEARVKNATGGSLYDNGIPHDGIVIHDVWFGRPQIGAGDSCFFNTQSGWAVPIDATPGDFDTTTCPGNPRYTTANPGLENSEFTVGMSYTNSAFGFRVNVASRSGPTYVVTVTSEDIIAGDFDGDARADMTYYQANGAWKILTSSSNYTASTTVNWGGAGYVPVPGDYDGDGKLDPAVYNTTTGQWIALKSSTNYTTTFSQSWGGTGYLPEPGDYDGDGKVDLGLYVQATGQWTILKSGAGYTTTLNVNWGGNGYTPVPGKDFDGDGKSDVAIYSESAGVWYILKSSTSFATPMNLNWGGHGYTLVAGDYDGDGKADPGLYDRGTGNWYVLLSGASYTTTINKSWGGAGYDPVPGDYDGDGKVDLGIVQRSTGNWYVLKSNTSYTTSFNVMGWGAGGDTLVSGAIVPGGGNDTRRATDFDGDGKADITVYNAGTSTWYSLTSSSSYAGAQNHSWGGVGYAPVPGDYDGDGKTDYGLYVFSTGAWSILLSGSGYTTTLSKSAGGGSYTPVVGDFDGDGKSDIAVYNTSTGNWFALKSSTNFTTTLSVNWGGAGYTAVPGDYDGDGKTDLGLYQASSGNWSVLLSSTNYTTTITKSAGGPSYSPVPGDYDGDGKTDFVAYNGVTGLWYGLKSSTNYTTTISVTWGGVGYNTIKGDFDGDGKADLALYQVSTGNWAILLSGSGYTTTLSKSWGGAGYSAVPLYP